MIGQVQNYSELLSELNDIELPLNLDTFLSFNKKNTNEVKLYNNVTKQGIGYIGHNGKFHKATSVYETGAITITYEKFENGKYEKYQANDSVSIQFIGLLKLSDKYTSMLVKIEVPNEHRKAYYYQLLSYDSNGEHLSTIVVFELVDDAATKVWLKEKPSPNVTSIIKKDGSVEIKWDEGYNEIYIQHVKLNDKGVFYVDKLDEKER